MQHHVLCPRQDASVGLGASIVADIAALIAPSPCSSATICATSVSVIVYFLPPKKFLLTFMPVSVTHCVASHEVPVETAFYSFLASLEALTPLVFLALYFAWNASEIMSPSVLVKIMSPSGDNHTSSVSIIHLVSTSWK